MTNPAALEIVVLVLVAILGTAVVFARTPIHQAMVAGAFGVPLAVLFLVFQAPDVALSEIVVGTIVVPTLVLIALAKTGGPKS